MDLKTVYRGLHARLVFEKQQIEITALFSAAAAGLTLLSAFLSLLWFNRIL
jgi:Ca-activated chloride channel family protein